MSEFDLRALLAALHEHDVRFVVIGGVAVGAHGYVRATEDLDLVPDPDPANLRLLTAALEALDSTMPTGGLDVVQRLRAVPPYSELAQDAIDSDLLGVPVRVCSLDRLRQMKRALSRTQDQLDLENLPEG